MFKQNTLWISTLLLVFMFFGMTIGYVLSAPVVTFGMDGSGNLDANIVTANDVSVDSTLTIGGVDYDPQLPYTYILWENSGYYAKNCVTGVITSNAAFHTLINSIQAEGQSYYLKSDTFVLSGKITLNKDKQTFTGEPGAVIDCNSGGYISLEASARAGSRKGLYFIRFYSLIFDGAGANNPAITSASIGSGFRTEHVVIEDCWFYDWQSTAYTLNLRNLEESYILKNNFDGAANAGAFILLECYDYLCGNVFIKDNFFSTWNTGASETYICVQIGGVTAGDIPTSYYIEGNHMLAQGSSYDAYLVVFDATECDIWRVRIAENRLESGSLFKLTAATDNQIYYLDVAYNSCYYGARTLMSFGADYTGNVRDSIIHDNDIRSESGGTVFGGTAYAGGSGEIVRIYNNNIRDSGGTIFDASIPSNMKVYGDMGDYILKASGTGTITATAYTVTHGLSYTPDAGDITINFTEDPTDPMGDVWLDGFSSTVFHVNVGGDPGTSDLDFAWAAERR
jgi:hypothetical protein